MGTKSPMPLLSADAIGNAAEEESQSKVERKWHNTEECQQSRGSA